MPNRIDDNALSTLAIQMQAKPGAYALLLGSGISSPAKIPTGWQVTMDLVRKLTVTQGQPEADDETMVAWYREKYGCDPSYSSLIEELSFTAATERDLLAKYFEPDPERQDERQPTFAHKAIARLMAKGIVKVVLTTNFDRLLEQALAQVGLTLDVVITDEGDLESAIPRVHASTVLVKVHGDYKRLNLRNSRERLSEYPEALAAYLGEIRRDYGFVIAGWSGGYDPALRTIMGLPSAYPTYWIEPFEPHSDTTELRRARLVTNIQGDADTTFDALLLKIEALERVIPTVHSASEATNIVKRLLTEPERYRIQLEDYLQESCTKLVETFDDPTWLDGLPADAPAARYGRALDLAAPCAAALATLTRYSDNPMHRSFLKDACNILSSLPYRNAGDVPRLLALRSIPFVALCVLADSGKYKELIELTEAQVRIAHWTESEMPLAQQIAQAGQVSPQVVRGLRPNPIGGFDAMKLMLERLPAGLFKHSQDGLYLAEFLLCLTYLCITERQELWPTNFLFDSASTAVLRDFLQDTRVDHNELLPDFRQLLKAYNAAISATTARFMQTNWGGFYSDAVVYYDQTHPQPEI